MHEIFKKTLVENKYSVTKSRLALFSSLQSGVPRSMNQLTLDLSSVMDRASIYRTINLFEKLGIVNRVQQGWKYKIELSDKFSPHHHHISCQKCNKIDSFDEPHEIENEINYIAKKHGYKLQNHTLELYGICSSCS